MLAEEIDVALDELETRLDRLRSLYEQYFLGIEKIEPTVARKDVDRRFWLLRRTQIRNTARRFRLQVLIQRYNTFQQYWVRICREIENGTYKRHLLKAQKNVGAEPKTWAAKRRLGYFRKRAEGENGSASERPSSGDDLAALLDDRTDLAAEAARAAEAAVVSAEARAREATVPSVAPAPRIVASPSPRAAPQGVRQSPPRGNDLELLDLDLDDDLGPSPAPVRTAARQAPGATATPAPRAAPPPAPRAAAQANAAAPAPRPAPAPSPGVAPAPRPAPAPSPGPAPAPRPAPAMPPAQRQAQTAPAAARPLPLPGANRPPPPRAPAPPPAQPPLARAPEPKPPALPDRAPPARPQPQPTAAASANLSDDRLRQIHAELSAAKRQAKQADAVSLDALSRSLRESEKKIRAQHPGKTVDFHVVVKDGKPIVKPIVRK